MTQGTTDSRGRIEPLLRIAGVSHSFRSQRGVPPVEVLRDVNLAIQPGELLVVAGRSGSGKSTLLNIAAGLLEPMAGQVFWSGRPVAAMTEDERSDGRLSEIGIVFQSGGLIDTLTAAENVALAAIPRGMSADARTRSLALLADRDLGDRANHRPGQLSGGEQQRVALARALFGEPTLLIVDEPTANLDRTTANRTIEDLIELADMGLGLLVASHDRELIKAAASIFELEQ